MRAALSLIFLLLCVNAGAADRLFVRPWIELEPLVRIDPARYPLPVDVAEKDILELGRVLFSGMIYGWTFTYNPGDKARNVTETFTLTPVAQVAWGNPRLRVTETEVSDARLWARIAYSLDDEESLRRSSWDSNTALLSTGSGSESVMVGPGGREASLRAAIRDAIRRSLDTRWVNKPRQVDGAVVLWEDPVTIVGSGTYTTQAKIKLMVRELVPYRIF
jgi:hypothetical protein